LLCVLSCRRSLPISDTHTHTLTLTHTHTHTHIPPHPPLPTPHTTSHSLTPPHTPPPAGAGASPACYRTLQLIIHSPKSSHPQTVGKHRKTHSAMRPRWMSVLTPGFNSPRSLFSLCYDPLSIS